MATKKVPDWTKADSFAALKRMKPTFPDYLADECPACGTWSLHPKSEPAAHPLCADEPVRRQKKMADPNQGSLGI